MLTKIISGGQTGADQGGLEAAETLDLETGGLMPAGFRTETGEAHGLSERYGMKESPSTDYAPRTRFNVLDSDGTVLFGDSDSPGSKLTLKVCKETNKPFLIVEAFDLFYLRLFREFLDMYKIETLNVSGNRESKFPGLQEKVSQFLVEALGVDQ